MAGDSQGHPQPIAAVLWHIKNAAGPSRKKTQHPCGCGNCPWEAGMGFNIRGCSFPCSPQPQGAGRLCTSQGFTSCFPCPSEDQHKGSHNWAGATVWDFSWDPPHAVAGNSQFTTQSGKRDPVRSRNTPIFSHPCHRGCKIPTPTAFCKLHFFPDLSFPAETVFVQDQWTDITQVLLEPNSHNQTPSPYLLWPGE